MSVYVDDAQNPFRGMIMCHMFADTTEELLQAVDAIGVQRKWIQHAGTYKEHFDIALSKRQLAIKHGAKIIDDHEVAALLKSRRLHSQGGK